MNAKFDNKR